jgi:DNA gyrase subunit A
MMVTDRGQMIRTKISEIRETGRYAQGVKIMSLGDGERVVALERIAEREDDDDGEASGGEEGGEGEGGNANGTSAKGVNGGNGASKNGKGFRSTRPPSPSESQRPPESGPGET